MRASLTSIGVLIGVSFLCSFAVGEDWPRFRGPNGSGVASDDANPPMEWSETNNVRWRIDLPGPGASSPIVKNGRVFVTCYTGYGTGEEDQTAAQLERHLLCFDRTNGKEIWRATVSSTNEEDPYQGFITEHGYASSSPVSDGEHIFAVFGKTGVAAFDWEGKQLWLTNVGTESDPYRWGGGASPVLYQGLVIVNASNMGNAIVALSADNGTEVWRYDDPELTNCWSTPIIVNANGRDELVLCVPKRILALNPTNGEELWFADSPIRQTTCASLVEHDGAVFAMGGRGGDAIGVRCGGAGDVTESHTLWIEKLRSGIGTPVVHEGRMFWTSVGKAFCASCETGKYLYQERVKDKTDDAPARPTGDYASAIAVGDRILLLSRSGVANILHANDEYRNLGQNKIEGDEGPFNATPAVSDNDLFIRSDKALYCISRIAG